MENTRSDIGVRSYRAAISLSNIGITMLQRHCYAEATATFRDALALMRDAADLSDGVTSEDEDRMNFLLQESSRRFAEVFSKEKRDSSSVFASSIVLSDDFNADFVQTALKEPSPHNHEAVVIRIDDRKEIDCDARFQFDSAIILFNYATATRCLGSFNVPSSPMILQAAYKSFHMSYGVLTKIKSAKSTEDDLLSIRVHLVAMLAAQQLAQSAIDLQMVEKAQEHYSLLCGLRAMYKRIERIPRMLNAAKSVAPAA